MAKRREYCNKVALLLIHWKWKKSAAVAVLSLIAIQSARAADAECVTVKDCAQQMVNLANELKADNIALTKRVEELEKSLTILTTKMQTRRRFLYLSGREMPIGAGGGYAKDTVYCKDKDENGRDKDGIALAGGARVQGAVALYFGQSFQDSNGRAWTTEARNLAGAERVGGTIVFYAVCAFD